MWFGLDDAVKIVKGEFAGEYGTVVDKEEGMFWVNIGFDVLCKEDEIMLVDGGYNEEVAEGRPAKRKAGFFD